MSRKLILFALAIHLLMGCRTIPKDVSQPPKGYSSNTALKIAYATGALKLVEMDFPIPETIKEFKDITYKTIDSTNLKLDIYHAKDILENAPLLLFVHGGSWKKGDKHDYLPYLISYAKKGYVTATVQYRFASVAKFPAQLEDLEAAVKWLKLNAHNYHINNTKVALIGGSAGGHLVLMNAYTNTADDTDEISANVQAVVNFYGPADLAIDSARDKEAVQYLIGKTYDEAPELYKNASPLHFVSNEAPPTLTFHGTLDELVPYQQSNKLHETLQAAGAISNYHLLKGWPHTMDAAKQVNAYAQYHMDAFFEKYLSQE